jgi:outer membrane protein OmpA-like peptidoglycan-associated protein
MNMIPIKHTLVGALGLPLLCGSLVACQASTRGSFSGNASFSAGATASGRGEVRATGGGQAGFRVGVVFFQGNELKYTGSSINFEYDKADLKGDETFKVLEDMKNVLKEKPKVRIRIEGHTDSRGTTEHNKKLSDRRADSIRKWLASHGIAEDRMESVGLGEDHADHHETAVCRNKLPTDPKEKEQCEKEWAESRRAVFTVLAGAETLAEPVKEVRREPESTKPEPEPAPPPPAEERRRWYLGGHIGGAKTSKDEDEAALRGFLGPDVGLWLTPRLSLGGTADVAFSPSGKATGRGLLWLEGHHATGPGPEFWVGGGIGPGKIPPGGGDTLLAMALRLGIDWHTSREVRLGPFLEVAFRGDVNWIGAGFRIAHDFYGAR